MRLLLMWDDGQGRGAGTTPHLNILMVKRLCLGSETVIRLN